METQDEFIGKLRGITFRRNVQTEPYVTVPPALLITDRRGDTWTLGNEWVQHGWRICFTVLRNDQFMGEHADRMEYRNGRLKVFGWYGSKVWDDNRRAFI